MGLFGMMLLLIVVGATLIAFYQLIRMAQRYQLKLRNGSNRQIIQSNEKQNLMKLQTSFINQTNSILDNSGLDSKFSSRGFVQNYSIFRLCRCLLLVELSNCHTIHQMSRGDYAYPMDMFNRIVIYQILILQIVSSISIGLVVVNSSNMVGFIITCIIMTIIFMIINYSCRYIHLYYKQRKNRLNGGVFNASLTGSHFYSDQQSPLPQKVKTDLEVDPLSHHTLEVQNEPFLIKQIEYGQKINYLKLYRIIFFTFSQIFFSVICINQLFWTQEKQLENTFFFLFILIISDFFLIRPILIVLIVWFKLIWIGCFRKQLITTILEKYSREKRMEEEMLDYRKKNKLKTLGKMAAWLSKRSKLDQLNEEEEEEEDESILKDELKFEEEQKFDYQKDSVDQQTELENAIDNECRLIEDQIQKLKRKGNLTEEEQKRLNELEQQLQKIKDQQQQKLINDIEQNINEQLELQEQIQTLKSKGNLTEEEQQRLNELESQLEQKQKQEQQMVQSFKNEQLKQKIERENEIQKLREKMEKEGLNDQELKRLNWLDKQQILASLNDNRLEQLKIQQEIDLLKLKQKGGKLTEEEQQRLNELELQLEQKQKEEDQLKDRLNQKESEIKRHDIEMYKKQKLQEQIELLQEIQRLRDKGDLTEEEQKRLNELENRLDQNKRELKQLDMMETECKREEYQMKQNILDKRLKQNIDEQIELEDEMQKLKSKKDLSEEEQNRLNELENRLDQKQKEQRHIQRMLELLEQQKQTEIIRVKNRKEIEQLEDEIQRLRNKGDLTEEEQERLNELESQLEQKLDLEQQLIAIQKDQEYKMREMEDKLQSEDQKKTLRNRKKELEKEQERIIEEQRILKNRIKELELEEIELQEEIQRLRNKGDLTEEEQERLNELENRLKEVQKEKMLCQQKLQLLYQEQQENQREQEYLKQQNSRIDEMSDGESDKEWGEDDDDEDSYERYEQDKYGYQQDFEMSDGDSQQDQNAYLENNSNEHSLQTQNSNDVTQFNKQSKTLLMSIINDSKNMTIDQQNKTVDQNSKTNILEQVKEQEQDQDASPQKQQQDEQQRQEDLQQQFKDMEQDLEKNDLSQSQIKTNFNKELKFNMSLSMDQNSIFNQLEHDMKDQQMATEQENNQSDSQILQLNNIFQNNKSNDKSNSLNTRNISFSSKPNLQGLDRNHNYIDSQKGSSIKQNKIKKMGQSDNKISKKVKNGLTKGSKGENQFLVKTSTQMDIKKKGVEYSLNYNLNDNFQKLDFNEIEKMFDKQNKKKQLGHQNSMMKSGKKFKYIDENKFGDQMQQRYQEKSQILGNIYDNNSRNVSQHSTMKKPLKKVKTFKKPINTQKQEQEQNSIDNFDYDVFLKEQDILDSLKNKKDQIKTKQPSKTVDKSKKKKKKEKEKKVLPPPKISNGKSPYQEYLPKLIDKQVKEQKIKEKEHKLNHNKLTMMMSRNDVSVVQNQHKINKVANVYQNHNNNQNQSILHDANRSVLGPSTNKKNRDNDILKDESLSPNKK